MRFRPCIDLHQGKVKQIVGGTLRDGEADQPVTNFETERSSADYARMYREDDLPGGHVIMLGPGNEGAARSALRAYPGGLQVGGGVNPENASQYLDAGASHVIVTSYVFRDGQVHYGNLERLVAAAGRERLVLDLSCRKRGGEYLVATDRWQKFTDVEVSQDSLQGLADYCAEFLVHGVDVEGKQQGMEHDLIEKLGEWSPIPVTYAGGATSLDDLDLVRSLGRGRVDLTIGSALDIFGGSVPYREVVEWQRGEG